MVHEDEIILNEQREESLDESRLETENRNRKPEFEIPHRTGLDIMDNEHESHIDKNLSDIQEISEKTGNYVLTFGKTGCGKSALQQHLIRWLIEENETATTHLDPIDDSWDAQCLLEDWKDSWDIGDFPPRSDRDVIKEFRLNIEPNIPKSKRLVYSFLEIAGEKFHNVIARNNSAPELPSDISEFLENDKICFCILLVCDGDNPRSRGKIPGDDQLFRSFLEYLRIIYEGRFERVPVLLVVSKWDKVVKQHMKGGNKFTIEDYMSKYLRGTRRILEGRSRGSVLFTEFSVGHVEKKVAKRNSSGEVVSEVDRIRKPNFTDIENISNWIYAVFTGTTLGNEGKTGKIFKSFIKIMSP